MSSHIIGVVTVPLTSPAWGFSKNVYDPTGGLIAVALIPAKC